MLDEKVNVDFRGFLNKFHFKTNIIYCIKWGIVSVIIGVVVGIAGSSFGHAIDLATRIWRSHSYTLYLMPIAGLLIAALYHFIHADISTFSSTVSAGKVFRAVCGDGIIIQPFLLFVCSISSNPPKKMSMLRQ